jgi:molybdopterin converting factor small subunit
MAGIRITVRLSGRLAERLGPRRTLDLAPGATAADLVAALGREADLGGDSVRGLAVVAGGAFVARDHPLADGDQLDVLVPVAGG